MREARLDATPRRAVFPAMLPRILLLGLLLSSANLQAVVLGPPRPVSAERIVPATTPVAHPLIAVSGDRALVVWQRAHAAVRLDEDGAPLDVPALILPKPEWISGADVVSDGSGWTVGWTTFALNGAASRLRLVHVSREGVVGAPRDLPLPFDVGQNQPLHLARREILLAAIPTATSPARTAVVAVSESGIAVVALVNDSVRELIATSTGFALLTDRTVFRLDAGGSITGEIALPDGFVGTDVAARDEALFIGGNATGEAAVVRIDGGSANAQMLARVPGRLGGDVRLASDDGDVVLVWKGTESMAAPMNPSPFYDLLAARVTSDGRVTGPAELRDRIGFVSRWLPPMDPPDVAVVNGRTMIVWSEAQNVFSAVLDDSMRLSEPRLINWQIANQSLVGAAAADGVILVVWREPSGAHNGRLTTFAARFDASGRALDPQPFTLGALEPISVRSTGRGFFVRGTNGYAHIGTAGAPLLVESDLVPLDLSCTAELCIAAWIDGRAPSSTVRISRWENGALLDAPGVIVAASSTSFGEVALSNDGVDFVAVFTRTAEAGVGTILDAGHIARKDGEWKIRVSAFAATTSAVAVLQLIREHGHYLATWSESEGGGGTYASRLSSDAQSLDGEETGWRGWPWPVAGAPGSLAHDGQRTYFISVEQQTSRLYALHGREATPLFDLGRGRAAIACSGNGRCLVATESDAETLEPTLVPRRISLRTLGPGRVRAVRH